MTGAAADLTQGACPPGTGGSAGKEIYMDTGIKKNGGEYVTIMIPKPYNVVGDTETVVGINGKMYQIQYDKPVTVPKNVAEVVEQSKDVQMKIMELTEKGVMRPGKAAMAEL